MSEHVPAPPVLHMDLREYTAGIQGLKVAIDALLGCTIFLKANDGRVLAQAGITGLEGTEATELTRLCAEIVGVLGGHLELASEGKAESIKQSLGICGAQHQLPGEHPMLCAFRPEHLPETHSWER